MYVRYQLIQIFHAKNNQPGNKEESEVSRLADEDYENLPDNKKIIGTIRALRFPFLSKEELAIVLNLAKELSKKPNGEQTWVPSFLGNTKTKCNVGFVIIQLRFRWNALTPEHQNQIEGWIQENESVFRDMNRLKIPSVNFTEQTIRVKFEFFCGLISLIRHFERIEKGDASFGSEYFSSFSAIARFFDLDSR